MIKCGELEGKDQCILYSKDGDKVLGRFSYSKHGGEKGAKAAAHKREGQIQFFKKKHQGLLDALQAFGASAVLKYLLETDCEDCQQVVKAHVAEWLEKAKAEEQPVEEPDVEKAEKKPPGFKEVWEKKYGGSVTECVKKLKGKVTNPEAYCAHLKDKVTGTTKWRGKEKKSFDETIEEALTLLQKDEDEEMELGDIDLSDLETWLAGEMEDAADVEPEPTDDAEPEPESDVEPEPAPVPEPEPEEEQPLDFHTFLLREHGQRRADILAMLGEEVEDG